MTTARAWDAPNDIDADPLTALQANASDIQLLRSHLEKVMERISVDPEVCHGRPCIRGTRIMVWQILDLLEAGKSFDDILTDYFPGIAVDDIRACIGFARNLVENEDIHVAGQQLAG